MLNSFLFKVEKGKRCCFVGNNGVLWKLEFGKFNFLIVFILLCVVIDLFRGVIVD